MTALAFLDTETVTLDLGHDVIWEIGLILRIGAVDQEWRWQMRPNMAKAHPKALEVSQFGKRFVLPDGESVFGWGPFNDEHPARMSRHVLATSLAAMLQGRHVVGAVPNFDTERLALFLGRHNRPATWHYHLIDIENLAVGWIHGRYGTNEEAERRAVTLPWDSDELSRAVGVEPPGDGVRHTALGDARWARDVYDTVTGVP